MSRRWAVRTKEQVIELCERCGAVYVAACRAVRIRERALDSAMRNGWRPL